MLNFARQGGVDGPSSSTGAAFAGASLLATVPDPAMPSKLEVGFDVPGSSNLPGTRFGTGAAQRRAPPLRCQPLPPFLPAAAAVAG